MPSSDTRTGPEVWMSPKSTRHSPWSKPDSASVPVSASETAAVCHAVGAEGVVFVGSAVSALTVSFCQADAWSAASRTRWRMECVPSPGSVTDPLLATVCVAPPSIWYSMTATPDVASVPLSVNTRVPAQPVGSEVVSWGVTWSIRSVWARQAETLPAPSAARVSMSWTPSVETVNVAGEAAGGWMAPPSMRHCTYAMSLGSVASTGTVVGIVCHAGSMVVVSVGGVVSPAALTLTYAVCQPDALPAPSTAWVSSR